MERGRSGYAEGQGEEKDDVGGGLFLLARPVSMSGPV